MLAAQSGATLADLMGRLGHTTPAMAMIYQHTAADRDRLIAERLSQVALAVAGEPARTGGRAPRPRGEASEQPTRLDA